LSFLIIEYSPRRLVTYVPAPLLAMATCASLAVGKPVPLLRDVVGAEAFRGGFKALRAAFPAAGSVQSADAVRAALSCGCELAAGGVDMM